MLNFFRNRFEITEGVKLIGEAMITNYKEWKQGEYYYYSEKDPDLRIWTCNGVPFIKIWGFTALSISEKIFLSRCIKKSMGKRLTDRKE